MNTNEMNTNRKELTLDEMEQVNGGSILAAIGLGTACVTLAVSAIKFGRKIYNDIIGQHKRGSTNRTYDP